MNESERKVTSLYCSKAKGAHEIARVIAIPERLGVVYRVDFAAAVYGTDGVHAHWTSWRPNPEASESSEARCAVCRKTYPLSLDQLVAAARRGEKAVQLTAEGMFINPLGVLDRQAQDRAC